MAKPSLPQSCYAPFSKSRVGGNGGSVLSGSASRALERQTRALPAFDKVGLAGLFPQVGGGTQNTSNGSDRPRTMMTSTSPSVAAAPA